MPEVCRFILKMMMIIMIYHLRNESFFFLKYIEYILCIIMDFTNTSEVNKMMYHNSSSDELKLQDGRVPFFTTLLHCSLMWSISWMNLIHHSLPYLYINSAFVRHTSCIVRTSFDFFSKNEFRFPELFFDA